MKRADFHFDLPADLIAQQPLPQRSGSRLLMVPRRHGPLRDAVFRDLPEFLRPHDLLVFNDTRVIPARLLAEKPTGGRVEILVERLLDEYSCTAQLRASKPVRAGSRLVLAGGPDLEVQGREGDFWRLASTPLPLSTILERYGRVPLPPYIARPDQPLDRERYQTVYASRPGAIAAPTAGLHFDADLLAQLDSAGVRRTMVTLHVGAGTFQPVRVEDIEQHRMHAEWLEVGSGVCDAVRLARARGGRVIAVGTTSVRSLETAAQAGELRPFRGETRLFIRPGYEFRVVDGMITNFHLPESTLLMLVSAFAGPERIRAAYGHAIGQRYRFFSYGDAMLID